ncbi:HNH endonuclease (plasmid) [Macrococcus equi]|uniref:HNH endonuclease n=1 Tax=Macrococcus equi TaxID=3395462 RepID=UPI0039BDC002
MTQLLTQEQLQKRLNLLLALDHARKVEESKQKIFYASVHGDIYSQHKKTKQVHLLKSTISNRGYYRVHIKGKNKRVQRLVAKAYLEDYAEHLQVNHIDGNKLNNRLDNLEMCTNADNHKHRKIKNHDDVKVIVSIQQLNNLELYLDTDDYEVTTMMLSDYGNMILEKMPILHK